MKICRSWVGTLGDDLTLTNLGNQEPFFYFPIQIFSLKITPDVSVAAIKKANPFGFLRRRTDFNHRSFMGSFCLRLTTIQGQKNQQSELKDQSFHVGFLIMRKV